MDSKGIVGCLMDFSFKEFVTVRVIPILYIIGIAGAALAALFIMGAGFASGHGASGAMSLIVAPVFFVFSVLGTRIWLEVMIAIFRVAEHTRRLADQAEGQVPAPAPTQTPEAGAGREM